jgi:hypothetical protein
VEQLELSMKAYVRGRGVDTFRMFNTSRAVGTIASATVPLKTDADVDKLPLGARWTVPLKTDAAVLVLPVALTCFNPK